MGTVMCSRHMLDPAFRQIRRQTLTTQNSNHIEAFMMTATFAFLLGAFMLQFFVIVTEKTFPGKYSFHIPPLTILYSVRVCVRVCMCGVLLGRVCVCLSVSMFLFVGETLHFHENALKD